MAHFCPGDPVTCPVLHLHWKPIEGELDVELFSLHKWHSVLNYRNMLVESPYLASWSVVLGRTYKNIQGRTFTGNIEKITEFSLTLNIEFSSPLMGL